VKRTSASPLGHELVAELLGRGLITPEDVVGGDVVLRDLSRRNRNVLVERRGSSHFVKWGLGRERAGGLRREADRCRLLSAAGLGSLVPSVHAYDDELGLLVLEGFPQARDFRAFHLQEEGFPPELGGLLGAAIARVHQVEWRERPEAWTTEAPWVLSIHRPTVRALQELAPSSVDLIKVIQGEPSIGRELDRLRESWRLQSVVHNDLKWDNVLLTTEDETSPRAVRLVDWEHACIGEPVWDLGSVIAGYLSFWVFSIDVPEGIQPEVLPRYARYPLESMTPAIGSLWAAYLAASGLRDESGNLALLAARAAGARLLVTAHEATQGGGAVNAHVILHVQLAANLLGRPQDAVGYLGLEPESRLRR